MRMRIVGSILLRVWRSPFRGVVEEYEEVKPCGEAKCLRYRRRHMDPMAVDHGDKESSPVEPP